MILIKSPKEIEYMREAGRIVALALAEMEKAIKPGITTRQLDKIPYEFRDENNRCIFINNWGLHGGHIRIS